MVERFDNRNVIKYERDDSCQVQAVYSAYRNKLRENWKVPLNRIKEHKWSNHMGKDRRVYVSQLRIKGNFLDHSHTHLLFAIVSIIVCLHPLPPKSVC